MNTGKLKELVHSTLLAFGTTYFQLAPSQSAFPILVYDIPAIYHQYSNSSDSGILTVDVYSDDITEVESIADSLQALDLMVLSNEYVTVTLYFEDMQYITDNDNIAIKRKRVTLNMLINGGTK